MGVGNALDAQGNVLFSTQENTRFSVSRSSENVYDAYGNQTGGSTTGSAKNYRGEYYDSETGLYTSTRAITTRPRSSSRRKIPIGAT